jgi:Flp pilus assembly protein TadD
MPQYTRALNIQALALAFTGRSEEALAVLATALAAAPEKAGLHSALGLAFERCGDLGHAAVAYREALRLRPENKAAADGLRRSTAWYRWLIPSHVIGRLRHLRRRRRS